MSTGRASSWRGITTRTLDRQRAMELIDYFVIFYFFILCFLLFLAVCVLEWKAKVEMAKRPFATVTLHMNVDSDTPVQHRRRGRVKQLTHGQQDVRAMAIEPTADGVAAVGTVFIRLPGKYRTPVGLALASALITLPRMYPTGSRAFLRRRGSTHGAPQPAQQPPPPRNN